MLSGSDAGAQSPYQKMLAANTTDWYIFQAYIPVKPAGVNSSTIYLEQGKYSATTDTTLLGHTYKKMYHVYYTPGNNNNQHMGYIREDSLQRKVYFLERNSTTEVVIYDFSLVQGNVTLLNFPDNFGEFPMGSYTVTHVDTVLTRVGYRRQFKLKSTASDTLIYIESIGSVIHPLYLYQSFYGSGQFAWGGGSSPCSYPYALGLACKESDNEKYYQSCTYELAQMNGCIYKYDSCNYYNGCSAVKELEKEINCRLLPNPASQKVTVELETKTEDLITIDLFDVTGRNVKTVFKDKLPSGKNTIHITVNEYEGGYYFLKLYSNDLSISRPLIISR
jgi:hypothetical protein